MRYLLAAIDQLATSQRGKELKAILAEAREGTDEKNASQEFYETLERIVNELRGWTEHSVPFLQKVRKAEAPNYYDIIKRPMDLGTVLKKVKGQQYKDKRSFADDLDLIWSNCLEYNTLPEHPLRRSAMMLKNKSHQLLQFVNDIHRSAAGTPGRETPDADGESDDEIEPDDTGATRKGLVSRKRGTQAAKSRARSEGLEAGSQPDVDVDSEQGRASRSISPVSQRERRGSTAPPARRKLTARTDLVPFDERPALVRSQEGMARFSAAEADTREPVASTSAVTLDVPAVAMPGTPSPIAKALPLPVQQLGGRARVPLPKSEPLQASLSEISVPSDPVRTWWESVVTPELLANGIPTVRFIDSEPVTTLQAPFDPVESPMGLKIAENVAMLQQLRKRRAELLGVHEKTVALPAPALSLPIALPVHLKYANAGENAQQSVRAVCIALAAHVGFEGVSMAFQSGNEGANRNRTAATGDAVSVLTDLTIELLSNLGRTVQLLNDRLSQVLSPSEILLCALRECGLSDPVDLPAHIQETVEGYGAKLRGLVERIANSTSLPADALEANDVFTNESEPIRHFDGPPQHVAITVDDIEEQIGLLQSVFRARATTEHAMHEDDTDPVKTKLWRPKAAPSGKIPTKRRAERDGNATGSAVKKVKRPKKSAQQQNGVASPSKDVDDLL